LAGGDLAVLVADGRGHVARGHVARGQLCGSSQMRMLYVAWPQERHVADAVDA